MKKTLFSLLLLLPLLGANEIPEKKVYLCMGPMSKVYHATPECKGLKNCSTEIQGITLEKAQKLKRRPCKICYKRE